MEQTVLYVLDPERMPGIVKAVVAEYDKEFNDNALQEMEHQLQRLDNDLNTMVDSLLDAPKAMHPRIYEKMEQLEAQRQELDLELSKLRIACGIRLTEEEVSAWLKSFCSGDPLDPAFRKRIIDIFINSIYLYYYDDKVSSFYNTRGGEQVSLIDLVDIESPDDPPDKSSDLKRLVLPMKPLENIAFSRGLFMKSILIILYRLQMQNIFREELLHDLS